MQLILLVLFEPLLQYETFFKKSNMKDKAAAKKNTLTFVMVSCVFLLFKCNVYLINSISVLNSNPLSHFESQSVLQELL